LSNISYSRLKVELNFASEVSFTTSSHIGKSSI